MERQEMLDGLQVSPAQVPEFQAYLRRQLLFEHQRRRLQQSQRRWMATAVAAVLMIGFTVIRPEVALNAHRTLFPGGESVALVGSADGGNETLASGSRQYDDVFARTVAASLEQDQALANYLGGNREEARALVPEESFVISRFPIARGREVEIYTALGVPLSTGQQNVQYASTGGVW